MLGDASGPAAGASNPWDVTSGSWDDVARLRCSLRSNGMALKVVPPAATRPTAEVDTLLPALHGVFATPLATVGGGWLCAVRAAATGPGLR